MPDENGISQNNDFYLFWLHALLAVFGVKKNPEFIHQGIQKHRQMMRYIPTSCPFIMKSFESATKNFIEHNLWFGLTLKREKRLEQEEMVSFLGTKQLPKYSMMHDFFHFC